MNLDLYYPPADIGQFAVLLRCRAAFAALGVTVNDRRDAPVNPQADALPVIHHKLATPETLDELAMWGRDCVVVERVDSATPWFRRIAQHPVVRRIVKVAVLDPALMNVEAKRYHTVRLGKAPTPPDVTLAPAQAAKYVPGPSFGSYDRMLRWRHRNIDFDAERSIDVHFVGTVDRYDGPIGEHRRRLVEVLRDMTGLNVVAESGRTLSGPEYDAQLMQAKVVVSPWGNGETCYRDWEALAAGCVLVKQYTEFARTWPDIHRDDLCMWCYFRGWPGLPLVVKTALEDYGRLRDRRIAGRAFALEAMDEHRIAEHFCRAIDIDATALAS